MNVTDTATSRLELFLYWLVREYGPSDMEVGIKWVEEVLPTTTACRLVEDPYILAHALTLVRRLLHVDNIKTLPTASPVKEKEADKQSLGFLLELVNIMEWSQRYNDGVRTHHICPHCRRAFGGGHDSGCKLHKLIMEVRNAVGQ